MTDDRGPPDGGWGWMCVLGKLFCYFSILGTASAFGIIYIDIIEYFNSTRWEAAWIGSLALGLPHLFSPLSSALISKIGIQKTTAVGTFIAFSGCFISWFATGIPYMYLSYGVVMGIGLGILFVPCQVIVIQYFKLRLGIANAIGSIGNGLGTLVLPPLYTYLLGEYGWRESLLILSGIVLNGFVCAVIFIPPPYLKSTLEPSPDESSKSTVCSNVVSVLRTPSFILYTVGTALAYFGYIVPFVHLPDMAVQVGLDKQEAAYLISIMGISNIIGRLVFGWISDFSCVNVVVLQGLSMLMCGVSTAVSPHLTDFSSLATYSIIHGVFIGVFASMVSITPVSLVGISRSADALGIVLCLAGISNTAASPLAGWLFDTTETYHASFYVAGCGFILGGMMNISALFLQKHQSRKQRKASGIPVQPMPQSHLVELQNSREIIFM